MPTAEAPYRRIANDIAAKIKSGELRSGDKLPSTREVAETYAVHMNTASRALTAPRPRADHRPSRTRHLRGGPPRAVAFPAWSTDRVATATPTLQRRSAQYP
ncbi:GntR family transcriptional regulator [Micromonospora sp. U21]|uniref:GntR family transcriptional regulator n=1 Tax=Micromonospora sp. U21 TaxID=2824899 RepID=UPI001FFD9189|nr:GntR family transcriptional regulator [Micromonospora sp. U21]